VSNDFTESLKCVLVKLRLEKKEVGFHRKSLAPSAFQTVRALWLGSGVLIWSPTCSLAFSSLHSFPFSALILSLNLTTTTGQLPRRQDADDHTHRNVHGETKWGASEREFYSLPRGR
jgi:hypothetical protein